VGESTNRVPKMGDSRFIQSEIAWGKACVIECKSTVLPVLYLAEEPDTCRFITLKKIDTRWSSF